MQILVFVFDWIFKLFSAVLEKDLGPRAGSIEEKPYRIGCAEGFQNFIDVGGTPSQRLSQLTIMLCVTDETLGSGIRSGKWGGLGCS